MIINDNHHRRSEPHFPPVYQSFISVPVNHENNQKFLSIVLYIVHFSNSKNIEIHAIQILKKFDVLKLQNSMMEESCYYIFINQFWYMSVTKYFGQ